MRGGGEMKAIETYYNGYRFRSRLEARWAVFFDALGAEWEYEIEGYDLDALGYYLPDFWLPEWNCFAEVKPGQLSQAEYDKCAALPKTCLLLDTSSPKVLNGYYATRMEWCSYQHYLSGDEYGRINLDHSKAKGRLWYLLGESITDYWIDLGPELAARAARFEHGEAHEILPANAISSHRSARGLYQGRQGRMARPVPDVRR